MARNLNLLFIVLLVACSAFGQASESDSLVLEGIERHDRGDYAGAMELYKRALSIAPKSAVAHYEIAMTYHALKDYAKSVEHCDVVLAQNGDLMEGAYVQKGSSLDMMGKASDAIEAYKAGTAAFPKSQLMHYNLGLTYFNANQYAEAEGSLQFAIQLNPKHGSSHLLLGFAMQRQQRRVKSLLAFYNFLLLEPKGQRATMAFKALNESLKSGVKKTGEKSTSITLLDNGDADEFSAVELTLSMLEASKSIEANALTSEYALFTKNMRLFFGTLGNLKGDKGGFWWNGYVDFFYALHKAEHVETLSYYIAQSSDDATVNSWLNDNAYKVVAMTKWFSSYQQKF